MSVVYIYTLFIYMFLLVVYYYNEFFLNIGQGGWGAVYFGCVCVSECVCVLSLIHI